MWFRHDLRFALGSVCKFAPEVGSGFGFVCAWGTGLQCGFKFVLGIEVECACESNFELNIGVGVGVEFEFKFAGLNFLDVVRNSRQCPVPNPKWGPKWPSGRPD